MCRRRSQVSEIAAALDADVESFRRRPLDGGSHRLVSLDALALRVREYGRIVSAAALIATSVNRDGRREILGLDVLAINREAAAARPTTPKSVDGFAASRRLALEERRSHQVTWQPADLSA